MLNQMITKKLVYKDATNVYGYSVSQPLPIHEIKFERGLRLEESLNRPDNSHIGYFSEGNLRYLFNIGQKTNNFPFCPENKSISKDDFNDYMKKIHRKTIYHISN